VLASVCDLANGYAELMSKNRKAHLDDLLEFILRETADFLEKVFSFLVTEYRGDSANIEATNRTIHFDAIQNFVLAEMAEDLQKLWNFLVMKYKDGSGTLEPTIQFNSFQDSIIAEMTKDLKEIGEFGTAEYKDANNSDKQKWEVIFMVALGVVGLISSIHIVIPGTISISAIFSVGIHLSCSQHQNDACFKVPAKELLTCLVCRKGMPDMHLCLKPSHML
jgi:hypothetical protein